MLLGCSGVFVLTFLLVVIVVVGGGVAPKPSPDGFWMYVERLHQCRG